MFFDVAKKDEIQFKRTFNDENRQNSFGDIYYLQIDIFKYYF